VTSRDLISLSVSLSLSQLADGEISVSWLGTGVEEVLQETEVEVVDRSFSIGDAVCRAVDPTGQSGTVTAVRMTCDLIPTSTVFSPREILSLQGVEERTIRRVDSRWITLTSKFAPDDAVVYQNYLGLVDDLVELVRVRFPDGSCCQFEADDANEVTFPEITLPGDIKITPRHFFTGQFVSAPGKFWRRTEWLSGHFSGEKVGVVLQIVPEEMHVQWLLPGDQATSAEPPRTSLRDFRSVTHVDCFDHLQARMGDLVYFEANHIESLYHREGVPFPAPKTETAPRRRKGSKMVGSPAVPEPASPVPPHLADLKGPGTPLLVLKTMTHVDVTWQDGTIDLDIMALTLIPRLTVDDNDFWPGDFVVTSLSGSLAL